MGTHVRTALSACVLLLSSVAVAQDLGAQSSQEPPPPPPEPPSLSSTRAVANPTAG